MISQTSHIELSRSAYSRNLRYLRGIIGHGVKFSSVVKGNAYGHGIELIVPIAEDAGVRHFAVFSAYEALRVTGVIRKNSDVMIMGKVDAEELEWTILHGVEFFVFDMSRLELAARIAEKLEKPARIHIELETGLNRTGFRPHQVEALATFLHRNSEHLTLEGLCTHYAGAENLANYERIQRQLATYREIHAALARLGIRAKLRHTASSSATLSYPETIMDMVRVGIAQYGFWPSPEIYMRRFEEIKEDGDPLERLISWKTRVMTITEVGTDEYIGYGTSFLTNKPTRVAIIPVGYAHGFTRSASNRGRVLIRGKRLGVIGTVTMNMIFVDITDAPEVEPGDEVVLIGDQGDQTCSVSSFSEMSKQLNYETLTRLPHDIPRKIVE